MTGRLQGSLYGRPVEIRADGRDLLVQLADLRSAWRVRRSVVFSLLPLLRALKDLGFKLRLEVGPRISLKILPAPHLLVRLLLPKLNLKSSISTA